MISCVTTRIAVRDLNSYASQPKVKNNRSMSFNVLRYVFICGWAYIPIIHALLTLIFSCLTCYDMSSMTLVSAKTKAAYSTCVWGFFCAEFQKVDEQMETAMHLEVLILASWSLICCSIFSGRGVNA